MEYKYKLDLLKLIAHKDYKREKDFLTGIDVAVAAVRIDQ